MLRSWAAARIYIDELCHACISHSDCTNRLRRPHPLPPLPSSRLLLPVSNLILPHMLFLTYRHAPFPRSLPFQTLPIIIPQPPERSLRRTPQIDQIRHVAMRGLMPYIDEKSRQANLLRLGVHGDFVFGFLLRVEEAGYEATRSCQLAGRRVWKSWRLGTRESSPR